LVDKNAGDLTCLNCQIWVLTVLTLFNIVSGMRLVTPQKGMIDHIQIYFKYISNITGWNRPVYSRNLWEICQTNHRDNHRNHAGNLS
jgi:hypothetical protein